VRASSNRTIRTNQSDQCWSIVNPPSRLREEFGRIGTRRVRFMTG
jgi:hypothetical protein